MLDTAALVLYFPTPQTATGEDVVEFHIHGGPAVIKSVLSAIPKAIPSHDKEQYAVRYAEPGEFTRRAFYNNRLQLTQIEALGDTLSAETEQQRRLAVQGSSNTLSARYEAWREQLLSARGELEALIDFSEDQHFEESPAKLISSISAQIERLCVQVRANIDNASRGELLRSGISIALVGAPNAGKSSLLNRIVGREAAIVNEEAGTTRDVIDAGVDIEGFYCRFGDLAGLRKHASIETEESEFPTIGNVEQEGIRRAKERALTSDVLVTVLSVNDDGHVELNSEVEDTLKKCRSDSRKIVYVVNKSDLLRKTPKEATCLALKDRIASRGLPSGPIFALSCKYAYESAGAKTDLGGIQAFLHSLTEIFKEMTSAVYVEGQTVAENTWEASLGASERQRTLLQRGLESMNTFLDMTRFKESERDVDIVLGAESLRAAADCLAKITGKGEAGDAEEVLGVVFEK